MAYENFVVERAGAIATVYFNRPEKLNPINNKLLSEMLEVAHELRDDEESRVVILTRQGTIVLRRRRHRRTHGERGPASAARPERCRAAARGAHRMASDG
jgi:enoyl-CoA hydratase/carnithine racemase